MKKIISLSLGFSFLIISYTGVILFIAPHGRISKWLDWHFLGLDKTQYQELHTTSMVTFLILAIWHIYFNWKPIVSYMKDSSRKISFTKKEFLIALLLNLLFIVGTITLIQPFKGFLDFGETIKSSWGEKSSQDKVIGNKTVAIKPPPAKLGRKTLQDLSDMGNIDLEKAIKVLKSKGIEVDSNSRIRPLSNELEVSTTEIYKMITE
ncbi:MAG: DUF4405 domain-containing protein [Arcobacteraceae bacterium]|nr:DUF4405 domain-containing protein [Arcobacteraceae bacterium]